MRSNGETRCINKQKPKTKIQMKDSKKYKAIYYMTCRTCCKSSERIWPTNVVLQSYGGNPELGYRDASSSSHELPTESRAKVEPGSDPNCDHCLETKITRASFRRRADAVMPRAEIFCDVITADHRVFSEESESRNNHRHAVVVQDLAFQWLQSCPCKTKTSHETQESPMKFLEPTTKPKH